MAGLSCGIACIKYILFAFNLLCALISIAIIAVGSILLASLGDLSSAENFEWFPIILIIVGVASFLISFFGCCGAIRESTCLVYTYSTFLMILLLIQVVLGAFMLIQMDEVLIELSNEMNNLWNNRDGNQQFWNVIQQSFRCCGLNNAAEWGLTIPNSCCNNNVACTLGTAFTQGCSLVTNDSFSFYGRLLSFVALGAAAIQLVGFIFSCILANGLRNQRDRRMV